jgi:N-acetylneuraminic acid mutarotase
MAVQRYDPATDTWQLLANYPIPAGHLACAGIAGEVYCAGGIRRGGTIWKDTYAYDPAANTWTKRADMPIELWGMGYTGSYDRLLVSGGITSSTITNEGFAYDPGTDSRTRLPAANNVTYRGGSTCGFNRGRRLVRQRLQPGREGRGAAHVRCVRAGRRAVDGAGHRHCHAGTR